VVNVTPSPDIEEEHGELRQVNGVRELCGHLETAPGKQLRQFIWLERIILVQRNSNQGN